MKQQHLAALSCGAAAVSIRLTPMNSRTLYSCLCTGLAVALQLVVAVFGVAGSAAAQEPAFQDPLDSPAKAVARPEFRPAMAITRAGESLIAVGPRGLVIVSVDGGKSWQQSAVPVQSDLVAVQFPVPDIGWIVGHDGVVLRSGDGGRTWLKQLDARSAGPQFRKFYQERADAGDTAASKALKLVAQNFKPGMALPYLDVWFENPNVGYAVGSYGLLIATVDGGQTWTPWFDRIDNEQLNLNGVRGINGDVMIVGEQGRVYRLDRDRGRFTAMSTGYAGSFFGLAGNANATLAFGLRGVVYRADAKGSDWQAIKTPSEATIAAGAVDPDHSRFLLVNGVGQILVGDSEGRSFVAVQPKQHMRLTGVLPLADGSVAVTGLGGVTVETLPALR